jgi:ABC-type lipoprotein release transport system permease subunit
MSGNCESVLALGAQSSDIQKLILVRGVRLALLGIVFGVAGSVALATSASSMLYGVTPAQPIELVWRFVVAGLCGFARMLCSGPQSHSRDPLVALRHE